MKSVMQRIINETKILYEHSMKKSQCKFFFIYFNINQKTEVSSFVYSTTCTYSTKC